MDSISTTFPAVFCLRQRFERPQVTEIESTVLQQVDTLQQASPLREGATVAVAVGSRGIANLPIIVRATVTAIQQHGAHPFLVPSMGSHGGATADGQRQVLHSLGVTEEFCGCPIRSSMETVEICHAEAGFPVCCDQLARQADHLLPIARVKPHTRFSGAHQSGLWKMLLIGLGKQAGAINFHRALESHSFESLVSSVAGEVIEKGNVWGGLAVVENAYDETALIQGVLPHAFVESDAALLAQATAWMPHLPFRRADLLLVDQIGKNISGSGMDTNIIGRKGNDHAAAPDEWPKIKRIAVRRLTEATAGNALGIGMAEFCRTQAVEQIDRQKTWVNCITSSHPTSAMVPIHYATDREVIAAALATIGMVPPEESEMMWIQDTLHLSEVICSAAYWDRAQEQDGFEVVSPPAPLPFDRQGNLPRSSLEAFIS